MSAMSGGWPPATAVARTVGRSLPTGLYRTLTFGYFSLNAAMTSANCFWPDEAVQIPSKVIEPLMPAVDPVDVETVAVVPEFALFLDPPRESRRPGREGAA